MATTFHVTNFKNKTIDWLTGINSSVTPLAYVVPYNGVQPADPSVVPAGTAEFSSYSYGPNMNTKLSAAGAGISQLATYVPPTTPSQAAAVSTLTFARIYTTGGVAVVDVDVSLSGGGGALILDSLTSTVAVGNTVRAFSFKIPFTSGTIALSASLANRLVDMWCGASSTIPQLGINTNGASNLLLYSGAAPATADAPATGTLLATIGIGASNIWAAASGGAAALAATPSALASGTGTAGYARLVKTYGAVTYTLQGSVGTAATDFVVDTVTLTSGVTTVTLTQATISL
jgi:hypothetical protein